MAEFDEPHRKRPGNHPGTGDDVYELADDDSPEPAPGEEGESPNLDQPGLLEDLEGESPRPAARPRPPGPEIPPPAPLPRIWKVAPESTPGPDRPAKVAEPTAKPDPPRAKSGRSKPQPNQEQRPAQPGNGLRRGGGEIERVGQIKKPGERTPPPKPARRKEKPVRAVKEPAGSDSEPKVLVEATPSLDTYEARQAARVIVGLVMLGLCVLSGLGVTWFYFGRSSPEPLASPDAPVAKAPAPAPQPTGETLEQEAQALLERAREAARKKDANLAIALLDRIVASYPNTQAAKEAREALARPAQNLPLFLDRPVVVASESQSQPKARADESPSQVVEATAPTAPMATSAEVGLVYPPNPAEPQRKSAAAVPEDNAAPVGRPLPAGFRSRPGTTVHSSGWPLEIVGERDGAPMVLVPGGEIVMGQDDGEPTEQPAHRVRLSTFYIDQHEVTVRQFDLFEKEIGRRTDRVRALAREKVDLPTSDDSPIVMVNAKEAKDFATWAGKRIPTEAQWEMAARGPDGRLYPWGMQPIDWKGKRQPRQIDPVMSFAEDVSPYGAYDMAGNAWEWTKDWYDPRFYFYLVKNQIVDDPTGPTIVPRSHQLSVRGGSKTWTITRREPLKFDQRLPFLGFRCALPVEGPDNAFQPKEKSTPAAGPASQPGQVDAPPPF